MYYRAFALTLTAVALATTACSGSSHHSGASDPSLDEKPFGTPVPSPTTSPLDSRPKLSGEPAISAPLIERLKYDLRQRTVVMAGRMAPTTVTCDKSSVSPTAGSTVNCTVTYEGIQVRWPVRIKGEGITGMSIAYDAYPSTGILTRDAVQADFWGNQHQTSTDLRCDVMPTAEAAPLETKSKYRCEYLYLSKVGGAEHKAWAAFSVIPTEQGPREQG